MEEQNQEPITQEQLNAERSRADQNDKRAKQSDARAQQFEERLRNFVIERELERAAQRTGAYQPAQVVALFKERATATPILGEDGSPTGYYEVRVAAETGESLTPRQAAELLRASDPNLYLSRSDVRVEDGQKSDESPKEMMARLARTDSAKYRQLRREHPEYLGLKRRGR